MSINEEFKYYVDYLKKYYEKQDKFTIIGMNDDRGFNVHKNILMNLKDILSSNKYEIELLDLCSMFFNKTRHIDSYLKHNVNMEEIRLMQEYGTTKEMNHAIGFDVPFMSSISKGFNKLMLTKAPIKGERKDIRISDTIKESENPLIMYASGLNDIMYELHINPFDLKKSYMDRNKSKKYDYACEKVNKDTIKRIIDGHERNFENILGLNKDSDIYSLSAYFYSEMKEDYEQRFKEAILMYNEGLEELCNKYNITYINCRFLENTKYNNPLANYLSKYPPEMIAYEIVRNMYQNAVEKEYRKTPVVEELVYDNKGATGVLEDLQKDYDKQKQISEETNDYEKQVALEKMMEHEREIDVFKQVEETTQKK